MNEGRCEETSLEVAFPCSFDQGHWITLQNKQYNCARVKMNHHTSMHPYTHPPTAAPPSLLSSHTTTSTVINHEPQTNLGRWGRWTCRRPPQTNTTVTEVILCESPTHRHRHRRYHHNHNHNQPPPSQTNLAR